MLRPTNLDETLGNDDDGQEEADYPQPPYKNPIILLNPNGMKMDFRPVSELEKELSSMNAVQF